MITSAQAIADVLKASVNHLTPNNELSMFLDMCNATVQDFEIDVLFDQSMAEWEIAMSLKYAITSRLDRAAEVRALAASRGYLLPDDPVPRFRELNEARSPFEALPIDRGEFDALGKSAVDLARVTKAYDDGRISFDRRQPAAQLANFEVSVDGMTPQSGDALVDLLGYQPDADFIKRKAALDSLSRLDFSNRRPYFLFIADVVRGGRREPGTIVCWAKMRDASGYTIHKRDVFAMSTYTPMTVSNAWIAERTAELLKTDSFVQALSFYDWLDADDVCAFVDPQTFPHALFAYEIEGVQRRAPATPFVFDVQFRSMYLTPAQLEEVTRLVNEEASPAGLGADSISPYPALSRVVYGDESHGWVLAGCNVLASRKRGDSSEQTRALSYVGSRLSTVVAEASAGRLVVPVDARVVQKNVESGISAYGIPQTLLSVLDGVGLTLFAAGKDELLGFQPTLESLERAGGGLAKIVAAIDPESATLDPRVLMAAAIDPTASRYGTSELPALGQDAGVGSRPIDLTTYAGITELMRLIRTVYDFHPGVLG